MIALLVALSGCGHANNSGLPPTALFNGVEGKSYAQGSQIIQDRLATLFPAGSSVRELRNYLQQQGLQIADANRSTPMSGVASFKYGGFVCGSQVRVNWNAGAAGKVETISALYADTGCP